MAVRAVHLVPDALDGQRVLADDQRAQATPSSTGSASLSTGAVEALGCRPWCGCARSSASAARVLGLRAGRRVLERLGPAFLVQMQRVHLELAIEPGHQSWVPESFSTSTSADGQRVVAALRREGVTREGREEGERGTRARGGTGILDVAWRS